MRSHDGCKSAVPAVFQAFCKGRQAAQLVWCQQAVLAGDEIAIAVVVGEGALGQLVFYIGQAGRRKIRPAGGGSAVSHGLAQGCGTGKGRA